MLCGPGPYTVFAPTDEASQAVPAKTLADLAATNGVIQVVGRVLMPLKK